ncbi:fructosamine kinase family protein [Vreelandella gomseomensis]|uniref:Fructosamine kinase family protein n=1 Tax=Vreelandella gomseomensis TaxID=370766 RepID=A0ABU1GGD5_9GAMM|nr:fructosamine kinase family protein [Halomonas gomseomensis]MDR5876538.1 fructosamine kinase family protein [Halomonas gomseomensis]
MESALTALLESSGLTPKGGLQPLSGGDIAAVYQLDTDQGSVVVKHDEADQLRGEAEALRALRGACTRLVVPQVLGLADGWLVMEALDTSGKRDDAALGEGLKELHSSVAEQHGWHWDNACGRTPQPNAPLGDGRAFQRERRLLPLGEACYQRGLIDKSLFERIVRQAHTLADWLPNRPASLVHGDLWYGNVLYTPSGPAIIDPAIYRHYPEVDIAMLTLFGSLDDTFFEAYWNGDAPTDWPRREALFQLYPLLNHVLLFGTSFRSGVERSIATLETYQDL